MQHLNAKLEASEQVHAVHLMLELICSIIILVLLDNHTYLMNHSSYSKYFDKFTPILPAKIFSTHQSSKESKKRHSITKFLSILIMAMHCN